MRYQREEEEERGTEAKAHRQGRPRRLLFLPQPLLPPSEVSTDIIIYFFYLLRSHASALTRFNLENGLATQHRERSFFPPLPPFLRAPTQGSLAQLFFSQQFDGDTWDLQDERNREPECAGEQR